MGSSRAYSLRGLPVPESQTGEGWKSAAACGSYRVRTWRPRPETRGAASKKGSRASGTPGTRSASSPAPSRALSRLWPSSPKTASAMECRPSRRNRRFSFLNLTACTRTGIVRDEVFAVSCEAPAPAEEALTAARKSSAAPRRSGQAARSCAPSSRLLARRRRRCPPRNTTGSRFPKGASRRGSPSGLPTYTFRRRPGELWRSRYEEERNPVVVTKAHCDFVSASCSPSPKLPYICRLYLREMVRSNFPGADADRSFERMAGLSLHPGSA